MINETNKPTKVFWAVGAVALLWNLMGVAEYLIQAYMTDEAMAAMSDAERALYESVPAWVTAAFATAVFGGTIACILLLLRRKSATIVYIISLIGILAQMVYNIGMSKAAEVYGPGGMVMPIMVILIGIFLVWYSKNSYQKGWIS